MSKIEPLNDIARWSYEEKDKSKQSSRSSAAVPVTITIEQSQSGGRDMAKIEHNQKGPRQRKMVAKANYDPEIRTHGYHERSKEEIPFNKNDVITVFGEMNRNGWYNGVVNRKKGLVPFDLLKLVDVSAEEAQVMQDLYKRSQLDGRESTIISFFTGLLFGALFCAVVLNGSEGRNTNASERLDPWMELEMEGMNQMYSKMNNTTIELFQRIVNLERRADRRNLTTEVRSLEDLFWNVSTTLRNSVDSN